LIYSAKYNAILWKNPHIRNMKQQLPIAITLLAAGSWLWISGNAAENRYDAVQLPREHSEAVATASPIQQTTEGSNDTVQLAGYQTPIESPLEPAIANRFPLSHQAASIPADSTEPSETAAFLRSVGERLRNSTPFKTELRIEIEWSKQRYPISGQYLQPGQGSGQSKLELSLNNASTPVTITKICDGRFLYSHFRQNEKQTLEFIDLARLGRSHQSMGLIEPNNPMSWISTGGMASVFENLAAAFEFAPLASAEVDGRAVCTLEGRWREEHLIDLLRPAVEHKHLTPKIQWSRLPKQIPHSVRLKLANVPEFGWMPQSITFFQSKVPNESRAEVSSEFSNAAFKSDHSVNIGSNPIALIEFGPPQPAMIDANDFLNLQNDEVESIDVTDQFVEQVQGYFHARTAAVSSGTVIR